MDNTASNISVDLYSDFRSELEELLLTALGEARLVPTLEAAVSHMLFPGGKRIRPLIALVFSSDLNGDWRGLLRAAASLELLHTSSLIHDDLPAMDNDVMRRGKPTCHVAFDEATAILAGDALVGMAFRNIAASDISASNTKDFLAELAQTYIKLCNGQQLDMAVHSREELKRIHELKTGALFSSAFRFAALSAGAKGKALDLSSELGLVVGLSFQIVDDLIDGKSAEKGRATSSDSKNQRTTFGVATDDRQKQEMLSQTKARIEAAILEFKVAFGKPELELLGTRTLIQEIFAKA